MESIKSIEKKIRLDLIYDYEAALKNLGFTQEDVNKVRKLTADDKFVPKFLVNSFILTFLNFCDGDHQKAADRIHAYYKFKKEVPEFFGNRDPQSAEVIQSLNNQHIVSFPVTPENSNFIGGGLVNADPNNYVFDNVTKVLIMLSEVYFMTNGPIKDISYVISLKNASFWHVLRPTISSVRKSLFFLEKVAPVNVKAVYILDTMPIVKYMIALARPFASKELLSRVHFFTSDHDWEEFHKNHIPKTHLTCDFNGDLPSLKALTEDTKKLLNEFREYFIMEEQQTFGKLDHLADEAKDQKW